VLWQTVRRFSKKGSLVFVTDLFRPSDRTAAEAILEKYAANEPEILRRDFFNSLFAAFTPREIEGQLKEAHISQLRVRVISDRHLIVWGEMSQ